MSTRTYKDYKEFFEKVNEENDKKNYHHSYILLFSFLENRIQRLFVEQLKHRSGRSDLKVKKDANRQSLFWKLIIKTGFNLIVITSIVRYIYYPVTKNKDYLFTYFLISLTVFILCILLDNVKLQLGFALGLFAIFGIIRYRTDPIPIKEMTYLFLVIGISVVNALANKKISHAELVFANLIIIFVTYGMERIWLLRHETRKNVIYEKIELVVPEKREELIEDLKARTGLNISRIEIRRIDFLKDIANIRVFYYEDTKD